MNDVANMTDKEFVHFLDNLPENPIAARAANLIAHYELENKALELKLARVLRSEERL